MHKTNIFIVLLFLVFSFYIYWSQLSNEVIEILSPDKIAVDINHNGITDNDEIICVNNIESFKLDSDEEFISKYGSETGVNSADLTGLGYLAQDYAQKTIQNKKVRLKFTGKTTSQCQFADVIYNGLDYGELLLNNGYALRDGQIRNEEKFKSNLDKARKLNLVILNHHSNKYHKLNCDYGKKSHDYVIIPQKQLPKGAKPCKYCHEANKKFRQAHEHKVSSMQILPPSLVHSTGSVSLSYTDFTKNLKPDGYCITNECRAFVKLVNEAKESIDIAIYGYDEVPAVTNALKKAHDRGVLIRFVYDTNSDGTVFYKDNSIIRNLASVCSTDTGKESGSIMHNKFIIFDRQKVFTGSMNFSKTGLSGYDENDVVIINSPDVAQLYEKEFEQMINGKFHNAKVSVTQNNRFKLGNTELEVYFSPADKSSRRIVELINNAKDYIYVPTFLITHKEITQTLINAKSRGVDVKIIMDANSTGTRNIKYKELRAAGIPLKFENFAGKLHSKTMIIDDCYVVMGSMNFSNSGENKNDENMLVITDSHFASEYKKFFIYLWQMVPDKYLTRTLRAESFESIGSCTDGIDNNFDGKIDIHDEGCKSK